MYRKYEKFIQLFKLQTEKKNKLPVKCKIPNCFGKHVAKNFCAKHYHIYKKGSPNI